MPDEIAGAGAAVAEGIGGGAGPEGGEGGGAPEPESEPGTPGETPGEGGGETPAGEEPAEGAEGEPAEPAEGEGEGEEAEPEPEDLETDGRRIDDKTRKAIAKLKKVDPLAAKAVAEAYFRENAYKKQFPTVQAARAAKATLDSLGGDEGITALQGEVESFRTEIKQMANGDPELIGQLYESDPRGLELSTGASIKFIGSKDADAFDRVVIPPMVTRLEKAGMYTSIPALLKLIQDGKGQEAYDLTLEIQKWLSDAKSMQKEQMDLAGRKDPEREAVAREREELATQKTKMFDDATGVDVNRMNNTALKRAIDPLFRELKLDADGRREFTNGLQQRIWKMMKEDSTFQMQQRAIAKKGDVQERAEFISGKFQELLPEAFRRYRNSLYPNYSKLKVVPKPKVAAGAAPTNGKKPAAAAAPVTTGATIKINYRPKFTDVNWSKTPDVMWLTGHAVLTSGKSVQFDRNLPANKM